jgi:hypothetical protein
MKLEIYTHNTTSLSEARCAYAKVTNTLNFIFKQTENIVKFSKLYVVIVGRVHML